MRVLLIGALMLSLAAKDKLEWKTGTVVFANHDFSKVGDVVGTQSGIVQTAHEQFDIDTDGATFTVEQWVVPNQMLRLAEGAKVHFAIDGKNVVIELANGKTRKPKLKATWPKKELPPK